MAEAYKVLGQASLAATTLTDIYTVPAATSTVLSTIVACNRTASPLATRVSVAVGGAADNLKQYLFYDTPIPANDSVVLTIGVTLATTDVVRAYAASLGISIGIFGTEIT
jgi:hypothetical protein